MSGPIVRKYGFPNFENIFGARKLEHGVDEQGQDPAKPASPSDAKAASENVKPSTDPATPKKS